MSDRTWCETIWTAQTYLPVPGMPNVNAYIDAYKQRRFEYLVHVKFLACENGVLHLLDRVTVFVDTIVAHAMDGGKSEAIQKAMDAFRAKFPIPKPPRMGTRTHP